MNTSSSEPVSRNIRRVWPIIIGIILFAALMALRDELSPVWARAAVAGLAFVAMTGGVLMSRRAQL